MDRGSYENRLGATSHHLQQVVRTQQFLLLAGVRGVVGEGGIAEVAEVANGNVFKEEDEYEDEYEEE